MRARLVLSLVISLVLAYLAVVSIQYAAAASNTMLVTAVYYDTYLPNEPDESFRLTNVSAGPINLANWAVGDGEGVVTLTGRISPATSISGN